MLPSRGLRPGHFAPLALRQSTIVRSHASRKFSSLPATASLSAPSCRTSPLQSARWRTGATGRSNVLLTASSVRYGSWYAPWSWGRSSTPTGPAEQVPIAEISHQPGTLSSTQPASEFAKHAEPVVTTATPELAPAGIDKAAFVDRTSSATGPTAESASTWSDAKTFEELLSDDPTKDVLPKAEFDPTQLIDHAGHLKELGLDYGYGMTTVFERTIESIYLSSGWGWAGSIMAAGVVVRCATFFFQALSSDKMAAMASLKPVTQPLQEKMEAAIAKGDKQQAELLRLQQQEIMKPHVGGFLSMGGFMIVQGWIGFSAFRFLRAMGELPVPGMNQDGFLWFSDLTVRDPYFILPAATTAIMYTVFKTGGETGVQNDVGQAAQRQKMFTGLAIFLGIVTAFQASALQLYFLMSGIMGGLTGWLLRQNSFRRMINIRTLPSKESNEMYSRVVKGELKLKDVKTRDGKIRYQSPKPTIKPENRRNSTTLSGINIKAGTALPAHLKPEAPKVDTDRPRLQDDDFEEGTQGKPLMQKLDYYRRNYRISYMWRRMTSGVEDMGRKAGYGGPKMTKEQEKRKRKAEEYEIERRRRFENRQ
ncbi:mitochondrial export translocase Oxa1 [Cucurbitaria berberidis CBS 394.84]|uniref:Mitochondrial export translocase Oxa1 n=1 Tax=Cucurbitaria berberidis CBS 394.84 TaxID=1168544 RepID=A0A9P4LA37_9PLEO|nr:mitochondrial export translocase Oxa1 [Cucurbitaria berberidis CBS 394.84]KAF1847971.1 mitochondrial export translocase Oxa1 [Cucurbitaria berberidis CBS 394.84]